MAGGGQQGAILRRRRRSGFPMGVCVWGVAVSGCAGSVVAGEGGGGGMAWERRICINRQFAYSFRVAPCRICIFSLSDFVENLKLFLKCTVPQPHTQVKPAPPSANLPHPTQTCPAQLKPAPPRSDLPRPPQTCPAQVKPAPPSSTLPRPAQTCHAQLKTATPSLLHPVSDRWLLAAVVAQT